MTGEASGRDETRAAAARRAGVRVRRLPRDQRNTGPATEARTRFEKETVALAIIRELAAGGDFAGVAVQHSSDLIIVYENRPPKLVSIKHREPHQRSGDSGWSWTTLHGQAVLADLYLWWKNTEESCTPAFWTNAGFVSRARELHAACTGEIAIPDAIIVRVAKLLSTSVNESRRFVEALELLGEPLPRRKEITACGIRETHMLIGRHRTSAGLYADKCYDALLTLVTILSLDGPDEGRPPATRCKASALADLDSDDRQDLEHRYLDAHNLLNVLLTEFDRCAAADLPDIGHHWEPDAQFTGREQELMGLAGLLRPGHRDPVAPVVVHGMAGCGKTSLAMQFAVLHRERLRPVFINASTRAGLVQALRQLAPHWDAGTWTSGIAEARTPVTPPLPGTSATLLILDGVTDANIVRGLIPRRSLCRVLITSTIRSLDDGYQQLELECWTRAESHDFLSSVLPHETSDDRNRLADALHHHPLALAQAANHCQLVGRPIKEFIELVRRAPMAALKLGEVSGHDVSIIEAIRLNVTEASRRDPNAADLLTLFAHLGAQPTPLSIFDTDWGLAEVATPIPFERTRRWRCRRASKPNGNKHARHQRLIRPVPTQRAQDIADRLRVPSIRDQALEALLRLSLVVVREEGLVIHPLVTLVTRDLSGDLQPWLEIGLGLLVKPLTLNPDEREGKLDEHLETLAELTVTAIEHDFHGMVIIVAAGHLTHRLSLLGQADITTTHSWTALDFGKRASELATQLANADPNWQLLALNTRAKLAHALELAGQIDEALEVLALNASTSQRIGRLRMWLNAVSNIATVAAKTGRRAVAEDALNQLSTMPTVFEISDDDRVEINHAKTQALRYLNRLDEAVAVNESMLELINP